MSEDFAYRAKVLITQRRYQDAVRLCRRGLLTDPSREEGRLVLGMALLAMRRFEEVRAEMLALLRARPEDAVARRLLGQAFLEAGDLVRAEEELLAAQRLLPSDPRIADLLNELAEASEASEPPSERSGRWAEPDDLQTMPGEAPDAVAAPAPPALLQRGAFDVTPPITPLPGDERTLPDTGSPALRLDLHVTGDVITKVLPEEDARRIIKAALQMTSGDAAAGESLDRAAAAPALPLPAAVPAGEAARVAVAESADDVLGAEPPTDVVGPPPARPRGVPTPIPPVAVDVKGWPAEPPPTITPVMPALVRAAARLAAATRGRSSLRPSVDAEPTPTPEIDETPAPTPAPSLAPTPAPVLAVPAAAPSPAPVSPPHGFDALEIDTKSYAAASEEARVRDAVRAPEPRARKASLEEVLIAQAKFAEAVSEISEVSEIDQSSLPRPVIESRAPAAPAPAEARSGPDAPPSGAPSEADSTDEEPESTVTEVPNSYRDGAARSPARPGAPPPAGPPPAPLEAGRPSSPMTVVAKPVGNLATQHAAEAVKASAPGVRSLPAPPVRPVPEPLRARPVSETVPAPSLPEERVTRALDPAERLDRDSSLPPARLSQPPSFLEPPAEPARSPRRSTPMPSIPPSLSSLPPAASLPPISPPPGRVTMPVIDEEAEPAQRSSKPTVDGSPRDFLGGDLRDSDDSLIGVVDRFDALSGRVPVAFARRDPPPRTPAPPAAASPKFPAAAAFKPPVRAPAVAAFDPLDRPLSPEEFESSISRSGPVADGSALTSSGEESPFLAPEDVISGSEQIQLPEAIARIAPALQSNGSPLDEPLSPDDFSYSGPGGGTPSVSVAPGATGDPLDEPLSPDDFSYEPGRAPSPRERAHEPAARAAPARPIIGPAPPMAVPRDALRPVPVHSSLAPVLPPDPLDEPLAPSEFSSVQAPAPAPASRKPSPKRAEPAKSPARAEAGPRPAPVRIVAKKGQAPVKVPTKPLPKQRGRTDSRLLRYAIPSAVGAVAVVLAVAGLMHYRAGLLQEKTIERAEKDESQGDYGSLRRALAAYREVADEEPDSREMLARVARVYALLAFEFGLPDDERQAQEQLARVEQMGVADATSAPIEAAARAYLLAAAGRVDDAEVRLRPFQVPDPHVSYLRARIFLQREAYAEADRILRASTSVAPSWVRQSCALVEAMLGKDPQGTEWLRLLESLGATYSSHVGVRLLRARLLSESPHTRENARIELQALAQPALWNAAAPSEQAWVHLLNALLASGRRGGRQDAQRELLMARDLRPARDSKFRLAFVRVLLGLHQLGEAKSELQSIVQDMAPRARSQARLLLAETHVELGELDDAERLLAQTEPSARQHWLLGRVLMARNRVQAAITEFNAAKQQDPSLALEVDLESSRAHLQIGEVTQAIELANAILNEHPNEVEALILVGDAYLADQSRQNRFAQAEEAYGRASRAAPESVEPLLRLAKLARGRGDLTGANQRLEQILSRDPANVDAHVARASIAVESGDLEDARAKLQRIQQLPGARAEAGATTVLEAEIELRGGNLAAVEALLVRAEQNGAPEGELKHVRGLFFLRTYKVQEALPALRRASQLAPGDAIRLAELARAYRLTDATAAQPFVDAALQIDARAVEALVVRALMQMEKGALTQAAQLVRSAEQALESRHRDKSTQAFVSMARGRYEWEMGRATEAQRSLERALALDPGLAEAQFYLGLTFSDLNRGSDACAALGRFLELAPSVREAADATAERRRLGCR